MCLAGLATGCDIDKMLEDAKGIVQQGLDRNEREARELASTHLGHDMDGTSLVDAAWSLSSSDPSTCFEISEMSAEGSHGGASATCDTTPHKLSRSCDSSLLLPSLLEISIGSEGQSEGMSVLP